MRFSFSRFIVGIVAAATLLFFAPTRAKADTYQLIGLGLDNQFSFYGLSSTGLAVFENDSTSLCGPGPTCFYSFLDGVFLGNTATAPVFTPDEGGSCSPGLPTLPSPGYVINSQCNGGYQMLTGEPDGQGTFPEELYASSPGFPLTEIPASFPETDARPLYLNSIGDAVYDDGFSDIWYEVVDLTTLPTPEPDSLLLLATGAIAGAFTLRRRFA
jgi:hypothetical protein